MMKARRVAEYVVSVRYSQRGPGVSRVPGPWVPLFQVRSLDGGSPAPWLRSFVKAYQRHGVPGGWFRVPGRMQVQRVSSRRRRATA
jgi:hypothetical protein